MIEICFLLFLVQAQTIKMAKKSGKKGGGNKKGGPPQKGGAQTKAPINKTKKDANVFKVSGKKGNKKAMACPIKLVRIFN